MLECELNFIVSRFYRVLIVAYGLLGIVAGLLAGLFGVGGGTIIVPVLLLCFGMQGVDPAVQMHLAVGTSLASIVITSISSTWAHHNANAVRWSLAAWLTPGLCAGVWLGAEFATALHGNTLKCLFGIFVLLVALQMAFAWQPTLIRDLPGRVGMALAGMVIGWVSALFGIGGGSLTVPFLGICRVRMQEAVATAAACGFPIAFAGALAYAWQGWSVSDLPAHSTGFVYVPAMLGISLTSVPSARLGARLAHHWPAVMLKRSFAIFLALIGVLFLINSY